MTSIIRATGYAIAAPVYDNGGALLNLRHPDYNAAGNGTTNDRAALAAVDTAAVVVSGAIVAGPGTYRISSNITVASPVLFHPGAKLSIDSGVTVTFAGELSAGLYQIFTGAGAVALTRGTLKEIFPEWWGAANGASSARNTTAIQAAILASLGVPDLTIGSQPTLLRAPVVLNALYPVTTVYLPRFAVLQGAAGQRRYGLSSTSNAPVLVLGRSLSETDWTQITLKNFDIEGTVSAGSSQVGIKASLSGASGYIAPLVLEDINIVATGGNGIDIVGADASSMIVYMYWRNVRVFNTTGLATHFKLGIVNALEFDNCTWTDCAGGFFIEDIGSGTTASETVRFSACHFEALGVQSGGSATTGAYGFKSSMYTGQYAFDGCYFEGCGNKAADTTGVAIDVRAPWMLSIRDSLLVSSNNLVAIRYGGQAKLEGNYIAGGVNNTAIFLLDQPQPGSDYSNLHLGKNKWDIAYTDAQLIKVTNGSLTTVTGFRCTNNNLETLPRTRRMVYRDSSLKTIDSGAIGFSWVSRLTDNSGGANTIAISGIGTIVKNTFNGRLLISVDAGANVGEFLVSAGGAIKLVNQTSTYFTVTKDTVTSLNVYHDGVLNAWVIQNKLAGAIKVAVKFDGIDSLQVADTGYYETQFAVTV